MAQVNVIQKVQSWLTPLLIVIIGYFSKANMDRIEKKMDDIVSIKIENATMRADITNLAGRVTRLENTRTTTVLTDDKMALAKPEDEYRVSKYIKN